MFAAREDSLATARGGGGNRWGESCRGMQLQMSTGWRNVYLHPFIQSYRVCTTLCRLEQIGATLCTTCITSFQTHTSQSCITSICYVQQGCQHYSPLKKLCHSCRIPIKPCTVAWCCQSNMLFSCHMYYRLGDSRAGCSWEQAQIDIPGKQGNLQFEQKISCHQQLACTALSRRRC